MTNAEVSNKWRETFNVGDWDGWKECCSDDVVMEDMAAGIKGDPLDFFYGYAQGWKTAFPDMTGELTNRIEAGNILVEEITWFGTNTGEIHTSDGGTIPPTGKEIAQKTCLILEIENGKVKSIKNYLDMMSFMGQLGLLPS